MTINDEIEEVAALDDHGYDSLIDSEMSCYNNSKSPTLFRKSSTMTPLDPMLSNTTTQADNISTKHDSESHANTIQIDTSGLNTDKSLAQMNGFINQLDESESQEGMNVEPVPVSGKPRDGIVS